MKKILIILLSVLCVSCHPSEEEYMEEVPSVGDIIVGSWWNDFSYYYGTDRYIYYNDFSSIIRFYEDGTGYWFFDGDKHYFNYELNGDILTIKLSNDNEVSFLAQVKDIFEMTLTYKDNKRRTFKIHCNNVTTRCNYYDKEI